MLSDKDLYHHHEITLTNKIVAYDIVFKACVEAIREAGKRGQLICRYNIPQYSIKPAYVKIDIESCADYVMKKVRDVNKNLKVGFVKPNILIINWMK